MYSQSLLQTPLLSKKTEQALENISKIFTTLLYMKSARLCEHAVRVSELSAATAARLRLPTHEINLIRYAGLLHDIGLLAIPNQILDKVPYLSRRELQLYKKHPELGANMLETSPPCQELIPYIRFHHERWDGTGYPKHLKSVNIPLGARIVAIANYYDTTIYSNPDFPKKSKAEVTKEIFSTSGILFDPDVTSAFLKVLYHD